MPLRTAIVAATVMPSANCAGDSPTIRVKYSAEQT
jgi:hypothetical protein